MHFAVLPLHPFFECFSHPIVLTFSSTAKKISEILICEASLKRMYPPLIPRILVTILFFLTSKIIAQDNLMIFLVSKKYLLKILAH